MKLAFQSKTGIMQGKDYNGVEVYAAYTYIEELKWGVIAKINKSEIVDPIKKSVIIVFLLYLIFITISSIALIKLSNPLLNKIIKSEQNLKTANENYEAVNEELRQNFEELLATKEQLEAGEISLVKKNEELLRANNELLIAKTIAEENEQRFRNLFEHSPIGKSMTGIDGSINVNNSFCKILGYSADELKSKNWKEITYNEDIKPTEEVIESLNLGKADIVRFEKRYIHKNGDIIWADVSLYLQRDKNNEPQFFITTLNDITLRKKALEDLSEALKQVEESKQSLLIKNEEFESINEELRQTNEELLYSKSKAEEGEKLKTAFLQNMSHEIRTPMNAICGFSERLNKLDLSIEKREKYTDIIIKSSD